MENLISPTVYIRGPNSNRILISDFPNSDGGIISLDNYRMRGVEIKSINFNNNYELQFIPLGDCDLTSEGSITLNSKTINIEPLLVNGRLISNEEVLSIWFYISGGFSINFINRVGFYVIFAGFEYR